MVNESYFIEEIEAIRNLTHLPDTKSSNIPAFHNRYSHPLHFRVPLLSVCSGVSPLLPGGFRSCNYLPLSSTSLPLPFPLDHFHLHTHLLKYLAFKTATIMSITSLDLISFYSYRHLSVPLPCKASQETDLIYCLHFFSALSLFNSPVWHRAPPRLFSSSHQQCLYC